MIKKLAIFFAAVVILFAIYPKTSEASTKVQGAIFDSFIYSDDDSKSLQFVVLKNKTGKTNNYRIDDGTFLFINNTMTSAEGFKYGMPVDITRDNLGKVIRMEGFSDIGDDEGAIVEDTRDLAGIVATIDPNGDYISVKLDSGATEDFYVTPNTEFFKGTENVDFSYMYEGDRVKMKFSEAATNALSEVEIIQDGVIIENLYRATLNNINTISNRMTVKGPESFANWEFGATNSKLLKTFKFNNSTSIYYGNKLIKKSDMRNYRNSEIYFVTTKINNEEIVKKIVILQNYERTFYDEISVINTKLNTLTLASKGAYFYHNGSILIRNGRLVDATSLSTSGSAFVLTDGKASSNYTHVVNVTNDSFLSPNLASHELYYGKLSSFDNGKYTVNTTDMYALKNNYWTKATKSSLSFSNNTNFYYHKGTVTLQAQNLYSVSGRYGYFYVKDGHIIAALFLDSGETVKNLIYTGRLSKIDTSNSSLDLNDATQWKNGAWITLPNIQSLKVGQTIIIKNGQLISASQLKKNDRIVIIADTNLNADILLVNE